MFSICGSMPEAEQTFFRLPKHDSCTWSAIILAHTKFGCADYALKLYSEMHREVEPADYAFNAAIQACSRIFAVNEGNIIHSHIVERCLESDVSLGNTLINMYAKCGTLEDAQCVFNNMSKPGIVAWCSIISGYADQGDSHKALQLFAEMHKGSVQPNLVSFISILKACSSIGCPMAGKLVHAVIVENNCADLKVANSLIDMYGKCGALEDAYLIFHGLFERTVVTWSTLFSVNADYGFGQVTLQLFQQMQHEGAEADHVALAGVLKACSQLHIGKFIHALLLEKGSNLDDFTGSILMEMYFRLLCPSNAYKIFRMLPKGNIQPWNAIITGSLQNGHLGDAISYFQGMQMENVAADNTTYTIVIKACSDNGQVDMGAMLFSLIIESSRHLNEVVGNALVSMYAKCGSLIDACKLFTKLSKRDAVAWSAIIAGHVLHGFGQEALKFYCQMQLDGKGADNVTFFSALKACSLISALNQGKLIHVQVIDSEWESDVQVGNSLIDMYSKCGKLYDAFMVFYNLPRKTVITWNALIAGLAYNNKYHQALELFKGMQQGRLKPNDATFACLLSACNRLGLVQEGRLLFESLSLIHGVSPKLDHYVCLMESMNRAGFLTDAIDLASILPFAPNLVTWTSLLTNCKAYGVLQLGKHALDFLITTEKICTGVCNYGQFFC
ncbi:hypothetical protein L7F22_024324 [Adiantum nelumboides]|nr:hypothetical protein [Adiantum nelumboides]